MGDSSTEIEGQIDETRSHLDANLTVLEGRVAAGARRAGRIAAMIGIGLVAAVGIGAAVYTLRRRRSLSTRIHDSVPESVRHLPRTVASKLRRPLPAVEVVIGDPEAVRRPNTWQSIAQSVGASHAVPIASALAARILRSRADTTSGGATK
jgi:hypothetical protein